MPLKNNLLLCCVWRVSSDNARSFFFCKASALGPAGMSCTSVDALDNLDEFESERVINHGAIIDGAIVDGAIERCMPGVGRSKIQPGRPRIREVLGRSAVPVATQPDDKRADGRVEGRNSAAFIGRDPKTPTKVGHLNLHVSKFAKMWRPI